MFLASIFSIDPIPILALDPLTSSALLRLKTLCTHSKHLKVGPNAYLSVLSYYHPWKKKAWWQEKLRKVENNICELASELLSEYISGPFSRGQSAHQMFTFPAMHEWWCHHLPSSSAVWKALKIRRKYRQVAALAAMHGAWRQAVPDAKWVNTRLLEISLTQQCGIHESERRKERTREVKFHISVFTQKCVVILKEPQVHFLFLSCKTLVTKGQLFQRFLSPPVL